MRIPVVCGTLAAAAPLVAACSLGGIPDLEPEPRRLAADLEPVQVFLAGNCDESPNAHNVHRLAEAFPRAVARHGFVSIVSLPKPQVNATDYGWTVLYDPCLRDELAEVHTRQQTVRFGPLTFEDAIDADIESAAFHEIQHIKDEADLPLLDGLTEHVCGSPAVREREAECALPVGGEVENGIDVALECRAYTGELLAASRIGTSARERAFVGERADLFCDALDVVGPDTREMVLTGTVRAWALR